MKLADLKKYDNITIQCHDNPDADAIASGYALFTYFRELGKNVALVYSGPNRIQKTNLVMMIDKLGIPISYIDHSRSKIEGLLITVDCQYGAGNVTFFEADDIAIIDHHLLEVKQEGHVVIRPNLGSCSTLVWELLGEENFDFDKHEDVSTALYYGLFMDTYQFLEIYNPLDMDMRDHIPHDKNLISLFRNSNISLQDLEVAGVAMLRCIYNDDYKYAIIKAAPCDPNILGLISDFLLQVDAVSVCVVYNETAGGFKLSVRSCTKEVSANDLAEYLTDKIGSGGGHAEKAGGFINKALYEQYYPTLHSEGYVGQRLNSYFGTIPVIYANEYDIDVHTMGKYIMKNRKVGYVPVGDLWNGSQVITIRTSEGDMDIVTDENLYLLIESNGRVTMCTREEFAVNYKETDEPYEINASYIPTARNRKNGKIKVLSDYTKCCSIIQEPTIYAKQLVSMVKIFGLHDENKYMLGRYGDYLVVNMDNLHDMSIMKADQFNEICSKIEG